jgi:hypothetical protein
MTRHSKLSTAVIAVALSLATSAQAECKLVGGIGNGLNEGIAKFMSEAALRNLLEGKGLKPSGEIRHKCTAATIGTECTATQQGCK